MTQRPSKCLVLVNSLPKKFTPPILGLSPFLIFKKLQRAACSKNSELLQPPLPMNWRWRQDDCHVFCEMVFLKDIFQGILKKKSPV